MEGLSTATSATEHDIRIFQQSRAAEEGAAKPRRRPSIAPRPPASSASSSKRARTEPHAPFRGPPSIPTVTEIQAVRLDLQCTYAAMSHSIAAGLMLGDGKYGIWDEGEGPPHRSESWRETLRILDKIPSDAGRQTSGAWNRVFELDDTLATALGCATTTPLVIRATDAEQEGALAYQSAVLELVYAFAAHEAGYGVAIHSAGVVLSEARGADETKPRWRLAMLMRCASGNLEDFFDIVPHNPIERQRVLERAAIGVFNACKSMSARKICHLDLKLGNLLYCDVGREIFIIDFDPQYICVCENLDPRAVLLVNLALVAAHIRASAKKQELGTAMLEFLQLPLLSLWVDAKTGGFAGAGDVARIRMPVASNDSKFSRSKRTFESDEEKLKVVFPAMCYSYLMDVDDKKQAAAVKGDWKYTEQSWEGRTEPLLIPQLLKYAFFRGRTVPEHWQTALEDAPLTN